MYCLAHRIIPLPDLYFTLTIKEENSMDKTTSLRERQVKEAVERMKLLELYPAVINEFINEKVINKSEHIGILKTTW